MWCFRSTRRQEKFQDSRVTLATKRHKSQRKKACDLCVTRLQLLVFWTKFSLSTFPSSQRRGGRDIKNNGSVPICRERGGQFGTPSKASRIALALRARLRRF